jgi:hypothetical protein
VHKIIRKNLANIDPSKYIFEKLDKDDLDEVKNLHSEWFPLVYSEKFYKRIFKKNVMAIGCFYPYENIDQQTGVVETQRVILGTIMTKLEYQNDTVNDIYSAKD